MTQNNYFSSNSRKTIRYFLSGSTGSYEKPVNETVIFEDKDRDFF